ncbi:MAG: PAS domain S-box protein [Thermoleophilia bacterium]|nr:PAS domain S-box protein [Thermoleophilia bacterium]
MGQNLLCAPALSPSADAEPSAAIRLNAFLDAALDAVVAIDGDGLITEFNRAAERMFGYAAADVIGQPMAELLIPARLREAHERGWRAALASGSGSRLGLRVEQAALRSDGSEFPVELGITRIDTEGGPAFAAFLRDLSDARRAQADLRQAEERNRKLVEQLPQVTYIEQLDHASASYISPQIEALVGYTPEEWTSDPAFFEKVLHPDDRERVLAGFAGMHESGQQLDCEYRLVARDGSVVWVRDGAVVVHDERTGRPLYAQGFMVDISGPEADRGGAPGERAALPRSRLRHRRDRLGGGPRVQLLVRQQARRGHSRFPDRALAQRARLHYAVFPSGRP